MNVTKAKATCLACALSLGICTTAIGEEVAASQADTTPVAESAPVAVITSPTATTQPAAEANEAKPTENSDEKSSACCSKPDAVSGEKSPEADKADGEKSEADTASTGYAPLTFQWTESSESEDVKEGGTDE